MQMENVKIKILKDTPFDRAGTEMSIKDFRLKYGYVCSNYINRKELVEYLLQFKSLDDFDDTISGPINLGKWFGVVNYQVEPPLEFIYGSKWYVKQLDGMYHIFSDPNDYKIWMLSDRSEFRPKVTIEHAKELLNNAKFSRNVLFAYTDLEQSMK